MITDNKVKQIIKRNGSIVPFNQEKITDAIFKAAVAVGGQDRKLAEKLSDEVVIILNDLYANTIPSVEEIQDIVEKVLIENGHAKTAKAYILYRAEHTRFREKREATISAEGTIPYKILWQTLSWNIDHSCDTVERLNRRVKDGTFPQLVEDGHKWYNYQIKRASEEILKKKDYIKLVIIAGPSSSGKTTATIKLSEELKKHNIEFVALNVDNYYFDLEHHPKDEYGDYDFETPHAIDLELINQHLEDLLKGKTIQVPRFNFKISKREKETDPMSLKPNQIIIIDSLHGLYDDMTKSVPPESEFKFYIETLAQIKDNNREFVRWTDIRLLRRMIRDSWHRSYSPERTLGHWHYVRRSEMKYIVPFINKVDFIFNSALPFELPVHKKYLFKYFPDMIKMYEGDHKKFDAYIRAKRVYELLNQIEELEDDSCIPSDSPLREFIGGSSYKY